MDERSSHGYKARLYKTSEKRSRKGHRLAKPHQAQETPQAKLKLDAGTHGQCQICLSWSCCSLSEHLGKNCLVSAVGDR